MLSFIFIQRTVGILQGRTVRYVYLYHAFRLEPELPCGHSFSRSLATGSTAVLAALHVAWVEAA